MEGRKEGERSRRSMKKVLKEEQIKVAQVTYGDRDLRECMESVVRIRAGSRL